MQFIISKFIVCFYYIKKTKKAKKWKNLVILSLIGVVRHKKIFSQYIYV